MFSNGTDKAATLFLLQSMFDPVFTHPAHILSKCFGKQGNDLVPYGYARRTLGAFSSRLLPANHIQKPPVHAAQASMRCPTALTPKALSHERKDLHNHEVGQLDQEQQGFDEVTLESMLLKPHIICSVSGNTIGPIVRARNPFKVDGRVEAAQGSMNCSGHNVKFHGIATAFDKRHKGSHVVDKPQTAPAPEGLCHRRQPHQDNAKLQLRDLRGLVIPNVKDTIVNLHHQCMTLEIWSDHQGTCWSNSESILRRIGRHQDPLDLRWVQRQQPLRLQLQESLHHLKARQDRPCQTHLQFGSILPFLNTIQAGPAHLAPASVAQKGQTAKNLCSHTWMKLSDASGLLDHGQYLQGESLPNPERDTALEAKKITFSLHWLMLFTGKRRPQQPCQLGTKPLGWTSWTLDVLDSQIIEVKRCKTGTKSPAARLQQSWESIKTCDC